MSKLNRYTFGRDSDGAIAFPKAVLKQIESEVLEHGELPTVSRVVRDAAAERILELSETLAFTTNRDKTESLLFICRQNKELLRLARAPVAPAAKAGVTAEGE